VRRDRIANYIPADTSGVVIDCKCGQRVRFMLHRDAKTSPAVVIDAKPDGRVQARATVANAFALPAGHPDDGGSCPGVTSECKNCYAAGLESWAPGFRRGVSANLDGLRHLYGCGGDRAVRRALGDIVRASEYAQRSAGVASPVFRWHSDGDLFASWYASAIRAVARDTSGVDHWLYTRSLSLVRYLVPSPGNLRVYISADRDNWREASRVAGRYGLPVAVLADDDGQAAELWARILSVSSVPAPVLCPASGSGKYATDGVPFPAHVTGIDGKRSSLRAGGQAVGACVACGVCLPGGTRSVTFTVHGGRASGDSLGRLGAAVRVRVLARSGDRS
jgi:hypothetical protein